MDKNTKIVPITLIINMNVEQIYFLRKKFEFNINHHCKSLIEKNEMNWNRIGKLGTKLGINTRLVKNEYGQLQSIENFLTW